MPGLILKR